MCVESGYIGQSRVCKIRYSDFKYQRVSWMNILLIGNGFDLEYGLPTKYVDFLEFVDR